MLIKQIKISNFRSYYDNVIIDFDSRENKNITLISGKNGFGKTSFLTSLIWGFYGKLMSKVEEKYRTEIKGSGGYENFLLQQFNRNQKNEEPNPYNSVEFKYSSQEFTQNLNTVYKN